MERIWLKNYPPGVPHDVDPNQYSSLTDLMETAFRDHADNPFSVCMERWMSFRELDTLSKGHGGMAARPRARAWQQGRDHAA